MSIDSFLVRLLILSLPGILGCKLYRDLTGKSYERAWEAFVDALFFSLLSYLVLALLFEVSGLLLPLEGTAVDRALRTVTLDAFLQSKEPPSPSWQGILAASILAVPIVYGTAWARKQGFTYRVGTSLGISTRVSEEDLWTLFLDSSPGDWFFVRDQEQQLLYFGAIHAYSESDRPRELWMNSVTVCDNRTGEILYETEWLYLSRNGHALSIEAPSSDTMKETEGRDS